MVRTYAHLETCLRQFLLQYFGEYDAPDFCGMCDRCVPRQYERGGTAAHVTPESSPVPAGPFTAGEEVEHAAWGRGVVQHVAEGELTVRFEDMGYRTLDLKTVLERNLLRAADKHGEP